jgi:hypothetical protein
MALIHTIQIQSEKRCSGTVSATRKSETKKYLACIVATTTEASLKVDADKKAAIEKELADWQVKLAALIAKLGITVEQAEATHKADSERWYNREDGLFATKDRIRKERAAKGAGEWNHVTDTEVKADLFARGFVDPYDRNGAYGIHEASERVEWHTRTLANWKAPVIGSQGVLTWCGNLGLAQKAIGGKEAQWAQKQGDTVAIRTDITITETKKREKK